MFINKHTKRIRSQKGMFLIDVLFAMLFFSITALGLIKAMTYSIQVRANIVRNAIATQFVMETLEEFAAIDPQTLSDANDTTDVVTQDGIEFDRVIDIIVNADGSRSIDVTVSGVNERLGNATASNTFALWGQGNYYVLCTKKSFEL